MDHDRNNEIMIQAAEICFLGKVAGVSLRDNVRSSVICEELEVELLFLGIERSQFEVVQVSRARHMSVTRQSKTRMHC